MGLHPVAPAPFGSCLFLIYAVFLCGVTNRAVKKRKKDAEQMYNKTGADPDLELRGGGGGGGRS